MIGFRKKKGRATIPSLSIWYKVATAISLGVIGLASTIFVISGVLIWIMNNGTIR